MRPEAAGFESANGISLKKLPFFSPQVDFGRSSLL
jgi:hypothetical protein